MYVIFLVYRTGPIGPIGEIGGLIPFPGKQCFHVQHTALPVGHAHLHS